ncbi:hypothetical protein, partial [Streptomyces sp. NPDC001919]
MSGATHTAGPRLYDRAAELAAVARLSAGVAAGRGGVLFVTGSPGEGRTALLSRAAHDFPGTAHRVAARVVARCSAASTSASAARPACRSTSP